MGDNVDPETGVRWWVRYVVVPLMSGGVLAVVVAGFLSNRSMKYEDKQSTVRASFKISGAEQLFESEGGLRSPADQKMILVTFSNLTPETIDLFWIGGQGNLVFYQTLGPNKTFKINTFPSHYWSIKTHIGSQLIGVVLPPREGGAIGISPAGG